MLLSCPVGAHTFTKWVGVPLAQEGEDFGMCSHGLVFPKYLFVVTILRTSNDKKPRSGHKIKICFVQIYVS